MAQEFYTLEEAASALGITPEALDQLRQENKVPSQEEQGALRFRVTQVQAYARNRQSLGLELSGSNPQILVPTPPRKTTGPKPRSGLQVPTPEGGFDVDLGPEGTPASTPPPAPGTVQPSILKLQDEPLGPTVGVDDFTLSTEDLGVGPGKTGTTGMTPGVPGKSGNTGMTPAAPGKSGTTGMTPPAPPPSANDDIFSSSMDDVSLEPSPLGQPAAGIPAPAAGGSDDIFSVDLDDVKLLDEPPPRSSRLKTSPPVPIPQDQAPAPEPIDLSGSDALPLSEDIGLPPPEPVDLSGSDALPLDEPAPTIPSTPGLPPESGDEFTISTDSFSGLSPEEQAGAAPPPPPGTVDAPASGAEFDLTLDADAGKAVAPATMLGGDDADIMFGDIDTSSLGDDSMIGIGDPPPDSMVGLGSSTSRKKMQPLGGGDIANLDLMPTDSIDLDAELAQADEMSMARRRSPSKAGLGKTKPPQPAGDLPGSSPFELSAADLDSPSAMGDSSAAGESALDSSFDGSAAGASEFELTLAPEDDNPLSLGDDENVDLGGPLTASDTSASNRAQLSGINLQAPADSGISLEAGDSSAADESVDFELTLDDESGGPKTSRGLAAAVDSDSEFELTLDESAGPATLPPQKKKSNLAGEQDIFETDFELPAVSGDESGSQAVALEQSDTDLESSDFDLAIEEVGDDSGSQVAALDESIDGGAPKTKAFSDSTDSSMSDADFTSDEELLEPEASSDGEEEEGPAPVTIPAAEADWGLYPLLMMIPCVVIMFMGLLMSYELMHNMTDYHRASRPSGLLVDAFAGMFKGEGQ